MRKYILVDPKGQAPGGQALRLGKHIQTAQDRRATFSGIANLCCDSPLVAALVSPLAAPKARLFLVSFWDVAIDKTMAQSYTQIKEMAPVPVVALEHKLGFALSVIARVYKDKGFRSFAEGWLSGRDRGAAAAQAIVKAAEEEERAAEDLEALAAWGAAGHNDVAAIQERDDESARTVHIARAATRFAEKPEDHDGVFAEISAALKDVRKLEKALDLDAIARQLVGPANVTEPHVLHAA